MRLGWILLLAGLTGVVAEASPTSTTTRRKAIGVYREGRKAAQAQDWGRAEAAFQRAIGLFPLHVESHHALGLVYLATRRYPEAVEALEAGRRAYLSYAALDELRAVKDDVKTQREIDGLREYIAALTTGRASAASVMEAITTTETRIQELQRNRRRPVDTVEVPARLSLELGVAHFRLGALVPAERHLQAALAVDPGLGEAHNNLAVIYLETGRALEARAAADRAERRGFRVNPELEERIADALAKRSASLERGLQ